MKKFSLAAVALATSLLVSGCVISVHGDDVNTDWDKLEHNNRKIISKLTPGMNVTEITALLGVPDFNELYNEDGKRVQVLFYRTHKTKSDGQTTKDECTPLVLQNGELSGWGDSAYSAI